jgi:hypothetical protein
MNVEEIVQNQARRSGSELVSYREVALPLFRVDVDLLVLDRIALPPIQEHVLRALDAGLEDADEVAGFLGIEPEIVRAEAVELLAADNLMLVSGEHDEPGRRLRLTSKGRRTVVEACQIQATERTLQVWVDGLTRKVLSVTGKGPRWFPAGQVASRGLVEIGASPRRRPNETEITLETVREKLAEESAGRQTKHEVIGITSLGKARRFAREALALAYEAPGEELSISLVIDGEPSEAHDVALAGALARSTRSVRAEDWHDARELASGVVPDDLLNQAAEVGDSEQIEDERAELRREQERLEIVAQGAASRELEDLRAELDHARERQHELQSALDNISVRQVAVYEHRGYLDRALAEAQQRILIVSPWIRHEVVEDQLIKRFREVLERGVELWIGYGISKEPSVRGKGKGDADREAERKLRQLGQDFPDLFHISRFGDTHAKVLVCDSRFSILTSFNWLSFRGDAKLEFRDERGYYVGLEDRVDHLFDSYRPRFL